MNDKEFGEALKVARKSKGWTQAELATAVGYTPRMIRDYEKGIRPVSEPLRAEMRRHLGDFDIQGDPVELAIRQTDLVDWRKSDVISVYQRHLLDQAEAERRSG